jgi:SAM-dependent methyltransferase
MQEKTLYEACPLCASADFSHLHTGDCSRHPLYQKPLSTALPWNTCEKCGHVFTNGYFTPEACEILFSKTNESQEVGYQIEQQRAVSARMVEKVLPYVSGGSWLDVGFGNGSLLFTAQEYGFTPVGIDLRKDTVTTLSSLGIEAYCEDLTTLELGTECAVISMADVLEHMPFPKDGLRAADRLLADDGLLFISMPNSENVLWNVLDAHDVNPYWGELEHYHNFSRSRLYDLLEESGFTPVRYGISERYRVCMEVIAKKA